MAKPHTCEIETFSLLSVKSLTLVVNNNKKNQRERERERGVRCSVCGGGGGQKRDISCILTVKRERETDRQTDRQTETDRDTERDRQRDTERHRGH